MHIRTAFNTVTQKSVVDKGLFSLTHPSTQTKNDYLVFMLLLWIEHYAASAWEKKKEKSLVSSDGVRKSHNYYIIYSYY